MRVLHYKMVFFTHLRLQVHYQVDVINGLGLQRQRQQIPFQQYHLMDILIVQHVSLLLQRQHLVLHQHHLQLQLFVVVVLQQVHIIIPTVVIILYKELMLEPQLFSTIQKHTLALLN